jgi:hypothetical protein
MSHWYITLPAIFVILLLTITFIFLHVKKQEKMAPTREIALKLMEWNDKLSKTGFTYSFSNDIFYSKKDASQRKFGYCHLYDEAMPLAGMIVDCEPIRFDYDNKHWLIELWKGQYGMATGAGVGIYNTVNDPIKSPRFNGMFYESILDDEDFSIEFILKKNKKVFLHKSAKQCWLTALKLGEFSKPSSLTLVTKLTFPSKKMLHSFISGLRNTGYTNHEFSKYHRTVSIHFTKPHTLQPASRTRVHEAIIQQGNESDCKSYAQLTSECTNTIDKLELLMISSSDLFDKTLKSFYPKELYSGYEAILPILKKMLTVNDNKKIDEPFSDSFDI